ncbi:enoyl-CoA hydratase/isomerase family protein [Vibrio sonorensis]|uniref:enoyl-CoA hydratase/isomerase family protein n=1 Tax=Vibrio sonorensis TaxID=1004316 RepID=UPI0008DABC18|nr:enoyl-CoA hydratase/isomerase family protein [Vibrio sonorensis]
MADTVRFEERQCIDGQSVLAIATLSNPASLNALTYKMLDLLNDKLKEWQERSEVKMVFLQGEGDKSFCAGGDVRTMYRVMSQGDEEETVEFCTRYFSLEYECDYRIHTYPKPIIGWGEGIVMGGGIGLFNGCSHKVVTPNSRLAMPEIHIGLFPDVGGTWFLNRMDEGIGLFLGLTGAIINAQDALDTKLADWVLRCENKVRLLKSLLGANWAAHEPEHIIKPILDELAIETQPYCPEAQLRPVWRDIQNACTNGDLMDVVANVLSLEGEEEWLRKAKKGLSEGSAISAHITYRQVRKYDHLSLEDCFKLELILAVRSALLGEFEEGVRSRLIDKDGKPEWLFDDVSLVTTSTIDLLFTSLWTPDEHPLANLGSNKDE